MSNAAHRLLHKASVNYFFTRKCNYACSFCFHTALSSHTLHVDDSLKMLAALREAGAEKINFAGGEPFLREYQPLLGQLVRGAKDVGFSSVSIITNGSMSATFPKWFAEYGQHVDILGISVDTLSPDTNLYHGRHARGVTVDSKHSREHLQHARRAQRTCYDHNVKFKINTVVTARNVAEDMSPLINELKPMRWKIFQVLPLSGENCGPGTTDPVLPLLIDADAFQSFVDRHRPLLFDPTVATPEDNSSMRASYILIDEHGRFLDCSTGAKTPTRSILEVGLEAAARELLGSEGGGFDRDVFYQRGGYFPASWSKSSTVST